MKVVTLIPARGGSKGIPRKNIIDVCGRPLLSYAIQESIKSVSSETWVSTDDDEISSIATSYGALVVERPDDISTDSSTSESALLHFVEKVNNVDILVFLQATCPFIEANDINKAVMLMSKYDSVISVSKFDQFLWIEDMPMYDINNRERRQNREQVYVETGSMFVTTKKGLLNNHNRISGKVGFVEVPKWRSVDIDTFDDLELARKLMDIKQRGK
jgi:CMP-N,N'-diacetyllegionaminic acid synthase